MKRLLSSSLLLFSFVFAAGQTAFAQQTEGGNGDATAEDNAAAAAQESTSAATALSGMLDPDGVLLLRISIAPRKTHGSRRRLPNPSRNS